MRSKLLVVAIGSLVMLSLGTTAVYAANVYTSKSRISPAKAGTRAAPVPVSAGLTFNVSDDQGQRPQAIQTYSVGLGAGVVPNTSLFPGCSFADANATVLPTACERGIVGGGSVKALAGAPADRSQKIPCYLDVTLINSVQRNHLYIRVDSRDAPGTPGDKQCGNVGGSTGAIQQHGSIDGRYVKTGQATAAGNARAAALLPIYSIRFTVPDALLKPLGALETAVIANVTNIKKLTRFVTVRRGTRRVRVRRGYLESIGCAKSPRKRRVSTVIYTDLSGATKQSSSTSPCTT